MALVIETSGLIKRFGSTIALDGLDLQVAQGEVHGFLGPNGAGKSTTLRVLLGLLRADGGRATMLGGDPWRDITALHRRVAYIPGDVNLWQQLFLAPEGTGPMRFFPLGCILALACAVASQRRPAR